MKTIKCFIVTICLALCGLQACMTEEEMKTVTGPSPTDGETPVSFTSTTGSGAVTRTINSGNTWVTNDSIGIYMTKRTGAVNDNISGSLADNRLYLVENGAQPQPNKLVAADPGQAMYFPGLPTTVWFAAYYPYLPSGTGGIVDYKYPIDLSDQRDTTHLDLLYAKDDNLGSGFSRAWTGNTVALVFDHKLSKIIIRLSRADKNTVSPPLSAQINGMSARGLLSLDDGTIANDADKSPIGMLGLEPESASFDTVFQTIILPHAITPGNETVDILTQAKQFVWTVPTGTPPAGGPNIIPNDKFDGGKVYLFDIELRETGAILFNAEIKAWDAWSPTTPGKDIDSTFQTATGAVYRVPVGLNPVTGKYVDTIQTVFIHQLEPFLMGTGYTPLASTWPATPMHKVSLTNAYLLGETEVTNAQYARFLTAVGAKVTGSDVRVRDINALISIVPTGTNNNSLGSYQATLITCATGDSVWTAVPANANKPATYVNWYGAMAYAVWAGGRLPTEAEWEYAARGTATGDFINGTSDGTGMSADKASGGYAVLGAVADVKTKKPSEWGLYDMFGNVWDWCLDRTLTNNEAYPSNQSVTNPEGTSTAVTTSTNATVRGSYFNTTEDKLSIGGSRGGATLNGNSTNIGFRILIPLK